MEKFQDVAHTGFLELQLDDTKNLSHYFEIEDLTFLLKDICTSPTPSMKQIAPRPLIVFSFEGFWESRKLLQWVWYSSELKSSTDLHQFSIFLQLKAVK